VPEDVKLGAHKGPDGDALITRDPETGALKREYKERPKSKEEAAARRKAVFEDAKQAIAKRDSEVKGQVDDAFSNAPVIDGRKAIVMDKLILGAGGGAVQDFATHSKEDRMGKGENGVPKIMALAERPDPWQ